MTAPDEPDWIPNPAWPIRLNEMPPPRPAPVVDDGDQILEEAP